MQLDATALSVEALVNPEHPLKLAVAEWARRHLDDPELTRRDRDGEFWADGFRRIAQRGILAVTAPERFGGRDRPLVEALLELEGLGLGCADNGLSFAAGAQLWSTQNAIQRFGTDEQKERYLAGLVAGRLRGAFCMSEPESGSDAFALRTTAEECADGYRLTGHKSWATLAPVADVFVVFASTRPSAGQWGITAFLVDAGTPGLVATPNREKMGWRTTPFGDVVLDDCLVPAANRLGPVGAGASIFSTVLDDERAFLFASELGAMERVITEGVRFARERQQFGRPVGDFQAVAHRLADMKLRHETARSLLYRTALAASQGRPITMLSALTKLHATESSLATALDAVRLRGARGFVSEFEVERELRDAVGGLFTSGTSDVQRNIVARLLGL
jgi:alkylation response protein AidB-like acyl-CoA dehydrogenase